MKKQIDITQIYLTKSCPGYGKITFESGYNITLHQEEIKTAQWIHDNLGGDIILLNEKSGSFGVKRPDFEWKGKLWELKSVKSEKSIDTALRKAIGQIFDNPGGVILDFQNTLEKKSQIEAVIKSRIETSCRFRIHIIIIYKEKLYKVLEYQ